MGIDIGSINLAIASLHAHKSDWENVGIPQRLAYLEDCIDRTLSVAQAWSAAACLAKGIDPESSLAGEEWVAGPISTIRHLRLLISSLAADGQLSPVGINQRNDGQLVAKILPANILDRILWLGYHGEIWLEPGYSASQGKIYREATPSKVSLILGAGNVSSIVAMDILAKLFAENQVVIVKMNPVNAYVGEYLSIAFAPLINDGFLHIVYGDAELGEYLCQHPQIDTIHITGSHRTYDAIVWGATPTEQQANKAANTPRNLKPITAELGCVTPILIVPGNWSKSDIKFQARQVAATIAHNASFNCAAGQVLVTAADWAQREDFLKTLRDELASTPSRQAYYPGAQTRYQTFLDKYPQAEPLSSRTEDIVPWTIIPNIPTSAGEYALTEEAFCGLLVEVSIDSSSTPEFLSQAVDFVNDRVWGTLSCTVIVDRQTQDMYSQEFDRAIADLKYGSIGVNLWSAMLFYFGSTTWGAYPGNSPANIGSGTGFVHNSYLFDYPQKSVVYAPFRIFPTPAWFATHKNLLNMAKKLLKFEAYPTWKNLPSVIIEALKG